MTQYISYSATDIGTVREKNQDTIGVLINLHPQVNAALGVVCDGVGGLEEGEYASASTYAKFAEWFQYEFPQMVEDENFIEVLRNRWTKLVENHNAFLYTYATERQKRMGTTLTALLLWKKRFYTIQVGDSRAYEITGQLRQLTEDQSLVAKEIREGILTKEQAKYDSRQNVLLQSIGYSKHILPEFATGEIVNGAGYLICSDGFYHHIAEEEMTEYLYRKDVNTAKIAKERIDVLINMVKQRGERDNISAAFIRCDEGCC